MRNDSVADRDTIAAIATAPGAGGVGIVRLSGPHARAIGETICARRLTARHAHHVRFGDADGEAIDDGIALYFAAPASYTGEDVVELQGHGGQAVLQAVLARACALGARHARPGEFSERAFLEGRLDLAQAEAVADLIAAGDVRAARAARRALDGEFSRRVEAIAAGLLAIRVHVEAAIDFADEPLDTLGGDALRADFDRVATELDQLLAAAQRGRRLRDGLHAVIVGPPNAGKSSLLNLLAGSDRAIVTDIAGTTRDLLHEVVRVDGVELTLVDTAGLREGGDVIEREGMRRASEELQRADLAIVVLDARDPEAGTAAVADAIRDVPRTLWLHNKADLLEDGPMPATDARESPLLLSARTGAGIEAFHARLRELAIGEAADAGEGAFTARARHVDALLRARSELADARGQLDHEALELAAEALRASHDALGEITGRVRADDLLGHIFSSFCIGK
ncbi:tRNA modification GTPase MnmE [Lysobacter concretionis Ko07 = DSM 16239]|uniref:tRNA modification GTPase MnmE n=1 Tax=Lysobacter concretionis Ko07 = DSM 16239 TaxID=1122185 RepID=A0A0A0EQC8_9GAMM|nr:MULTISPECIES: tRNA uridine-5-carboxymethylaminomethyl(34) synthesis GTPase MnmE [Lysobacter]KGM52684.1 tRNA modification GTPase MnmE [Lysobacter concretionis Ko07 = DSM 16239]QOD91117.1 tRNA uridine-5-carboxymethylaminomethyl(34) synthesis GTPase MnmE [Lysobacter sp. CW239]